MVNLLLIPSPLQKMELLTEKIWLKLCPPRPEFCSGGRGARAPNRGTPIENTERHNVKMRIAAVARFVFVLNVGGTT